MDDPWDDLLSRVPAEPMPADLPGRVLRRLRRERVAERRRRLLFDVAMAALFLVSALALWPQLGGAPDWLPGSAGDLMGWASRFGSQPAQATWQALIVVSEWAHRVADGFSAQGLLGLALLAVPLFAWLRRLVPETKPDRAGSMAEEGVGG